MDEYRISLDDVSSDALFHGTTTGQASNICQHGFTENPERLSLRASRFVQAANGRFGYNHPMNRPRSAFFYLNREDAARTHQCVLVIDDTQLQSQLFVADAKAFSEVIENAPSKRRAADGPYDNEERAAVKYYLDTVQPVNSASEARAIAGGYERPEVFAECPITADAVLGYL